MLDGFFGAVIEAWAQLRIGKLRVLLSLVGVAAAVAAMTFTIALGQVSVSAINDEIEQYTGRPGTVLINVTPTGRGITNDTEDSADETADAGASGAGQGPAGAGGSADAAGSAGSSGSADSSGSAGSAASARTAEKVSAAMDTFVARHAVGAWATNYQTKTRFAFPDGPRSVETTVVSMGYGLLHHTPVAQGRWFSSEDEDDFSPSIVVSQGFLDAMGLTSLEGPVKVTSYSPSRTTYTIVGVLEPENLQFCSTVDAEGNARPCEQPLKVIALNTSYEYWLPDGAQKPVPALEIWAGPEGTQEITGLAKRAFDAQFGQGSTQISNNLKAGTQVNSGTFTKVVTAAGLLVMILGALGLVNISMVTVRQRIHEIGVRRSFGATSRRIFFSIMLESVVATMVAGVVGIGIAIVAMRLVPLALILGIPVSTIPPFPMSAAFIGLLAATAVGALSGIVPAIVAVRIRPIDAIRY